MGSNQGSCIIYLDLLNRSVICSKWSCVVGTGFFWLNKSILLSRRWCLGRVLLAPLVILLCCLFTDHITIGVVCPVVQFLFVTVSQRAFLPGWRVTTFLLSLIFRPRPNSRKLSTQSTQSTGIINFRDLLSSFYFMAGVASLLSKFVL